jgi:LacI family transcriptional regulator, galactose operon repressor
MGPTGGEPRIDDVAARAGVSVGTVSNVLNRPFSVSERTRDKVRAAIAELGFVSDQQARALAAGISRTIGFVAYDLGNSFFLDMVRGAAAEVEKRGMNFLIADAHNDLEQEFVYLSLFDEQRVAGILVAPLPSKSDENAAPGRWSRDVVVLNSSPGPERCCATTDNEVGGYLATRHLI